MRNASSTAALTLALLQTACDVRQNPVATGSLPALEIPRENVALGFEHAAQARDSAHSGLIGAYFGLEAASQLWQSARVASEALQGEPRVASFSAEAVNAIFDLRFSLAKENRFELHRSNAIAQAPLLAQSRANFFIAQVKVDDLRACAKLESALASSFQAFDESMKFARAVDGLAEFIRRDPDFYSLAATTRNAVDELHLAATFVARNEYTVKLRDRMLTNSVALGMYVTLANDATAAAPR